jgi:hypothetical protein
MKTFDFCYSFFLEQFIIIIIIDWDHQSVILDDCVKL